ncbi:TonB-dependent receptor plug domain-containing protein [Phenylobacterium sp.]|uniref:TonB-dependent receptor plug domain-containing protein n=1 Tax=Phenylobacterium sp. TaxID=1871053 RepID=UPI0035B315F5
MIHAAAASILALTAAAGPPAPADRAETETPDGVISYPPEFFAAARPTTALDMVQRLPGFAFDGGDSVRGFEGAAGNVLIDGKRPISKTDDLEEILRRLPASQVERIDLIRGGAPGVDMHGKSVLANVIRRSGGGARGLVATWNGHVYDGRDAPGVRIEGSGGSGGRNWEAGVRWTRGVDDGAGEGPRTRIDGAGVPLILSSIDSRGDGETSTLTGAYETPLASGAFRINGRLYQDLYDYQEDNLGRFPDTHLEHSHDSDDTQETELGLRFSRPFTPKTDLELIGLFQTKDETYGSTFDAPSYGELFELDRQSSESIVRSVFSYRWRPNLSFEAGGEGALNKLESGTRYTQQGVPVALPAANVRIEEKRGELFAKAVWRPTTAWTLEAGLREEGSTVTSEGDVVLEKTITFLKPRLALTWSPGPKTQLRARVERTAGQLDFDDFVATSSLNTGVVTAGNPNLSPESAWVVEAGVERRFWAKGAIVASVRHSELTDVVDRAPVFGPNGVFDAPANIGEGTKDELILNLTLPFDRFGLKGAQLQAEGTWRRSKVTDPTTGDSREISKLRPLEWEAHFTQDLPQWRMNWGIDAYGAWRETSYRYDQVSTTKLKTFVKPFVQWKPRPDLILRVEVQNATERGLRRTLTVYDGPRGASPIAFTDDRDNQFGRILFIRLQKNLGG